MPNHNEMGSADDRGEKFATEVVAPSCPAPIEDFAVVDAMYRYGGSFVRALAEAFHHADIVNIARLKVAFPEYWAEYTRMAVLVRQREIAAGQE